MAKIENGARGRRRRTAARWSSGQRSRQRRVGVRRRYAVNHEEIVADTVSRLARDAVMIYRDYREIYDARLAQRSGGGRFQSPFGSGW